MIRRALLIAAVSAMLTAPAGAEGKGPNGGMVVTADEHPIEFVVREKEIVFYLSDHDGKPLPTKDVKARAVVQDGGKTMTIALTPSEPNLLVGKLASPLGAKARVVFSSVFEGHALQARFVAP
jgi:hypothetical protein